MVGVLMRSAAYEFPVVSFRAYGIHYLWFFFCTRPIFHPPIRVLALVGVVFIFSNEYVSLEMHCMQRIRMMNTRNEYGARWLAVCVFCL